jgi:hypothetical protein
MRAFTLLATSVLLLAGMPSVSNAVADVSPDGWGQFRFGMTPEQAHAVPGFSWQRDINIPTMAMMFSLPMTSEYGPNTNVSLSFNGDKKLNDIRLSAGDTRSAANCEKSFLDTLGRLDRKYGAFAPGGEKDINWFVQDALIKGGLLERTSALNLSGSRSRYWHRTILPNVSGINVEAEAKHSSGSRSIEVMMYQKDGDGKDGKDGCHRTIAFSADMPSKAQLEVQFKLSHIPTGMDWHWAEVDRLGRGFSSGPAQTVFSTGPAENVRLSGGHFAADIKRPPGSQRAGTVHLVGTISNNKISAHVPASEAVSDDFPTSFEGYISTFTTDGEPVDTYEISLVGKGRRGVTQLAFAAYHRNSPHTPTTAACAKIAEDAFRARNSPGEITYKGFLHALGCPPP